MIQTLVSISPPPLLPHHPHSSLLPLPSPDCALPWQPGQSVVPCPSVLDTCVHETRGEREEGGMEGGRRERGGRREGGGGREGRKRRGGE